MGKEDPQLQQLGHGYHYTNVFEPLKYKHTGLPLHYCAGNSEIKADRATTTLLCSNLRIQAYRATTTLTCSDLRNTSGQSYRNGFGPPKYKHTGQPLH